MAKIIEINNGNKTIKLLAESDVPVNGWCSILGIWTKRYTTGGKFFKYFFSLSAIFIADNSGFDLSTEEGIKNAVHNKEESIKAYKDDQLMNFFSSAESNLPACIQELEPFIGKGLEAIYQHTIYQDDTVLAVLEAKDTDASAHHTHKAVSASQFTTVIDATHRDYIIITDKNIKIIKRDSVPSFIARTQIYHNNIRLFDINNLEYDKSKSPNQLFIILKNLVKHTLTFINKDDTSIAHNLLSFLLQGSKLREEAESTLANITAAAKFDKVKKLFEDGIIDKEEYEKIKKKVM